LNSDATKFFRDNKDQKWERLEELAMASISYRDQDYTKFRYAKLAHVTLVLLHLAHLHSQSTDNTYLERELERVVS